MRYYVTAPQGETGPFEESHIRGWLREGTMPRDAMVRAEDQTSGTPARNVFPEEVPSPRVVDENPWPTPAPNMYAPPTYSGGSSDYLPMNQGNFASGFVFGFFCGCIALICSYTMDSMGFETKRGIRIGFAVGMAIGILG
ncbi:MAG: hypothetical protein ABJE95_25985, partial [Byssovorax sp.]